MKNKNTYKVTTLLSDGVQFTLPITAYGISWIPSAVEKQLRINCPNTYLQAEIIKIEKTA